MTRFVVLRQSVRWKGVTYRKGELLPENFTDRLRYRLLYPSRVGPIQIDSLEGAETDETPETDISDNVNENSAEANSNEVTKTVESNISAAGEVITSEQATLTGDQGCGPGDPGAQGVSGIDGVKEAIVDKVLTAKAISGKPIAAKAISKNTGA